MIYWNNVESDIKLKKASDYYNKLSLIDLVFIATKAHQEQMIVLDEQCLIGIKEHLMTSRNELGGLLIGQVYQDDISDSISVVHVTRYIPSADFDSTGVSLRMESNIWNSARQTIESYGLMVVGWYHSHPNLGAFFSGTDRRTQKNIFNQKYSVGLVIDPVRDEMKWFVGPDCIEITNGNLLKKKTTIIQ